MPDTIRTIGELNALLGDNTTGDISAQDLRDVLVSMNVHTEIGRNVLSTSIGTSYVKVPMTAAGAFERGFVADLPNDQINGTPVDMKAMISVELQIDSLQTDRIVDFAIFVTGVEVPNLTRTFLEGATPGHYSWAVGVQLLQNDTIELRAKANLAGTAITVGFIVLRAQRIGIE